MKLLISCIFLLFAHLNIAQGQPAQRYRQLPCSKTSKNYSDSFIRYMQIHLLNTADAVIL